MPNGAFHRWEYQGKRPNLLAKVQNRVSAWLFASRVFPPAYITLEVPGRKSARAITLPLAMLIRGQERFLVSMLGEQVQWVRNVEANNNRAVLIKDGREVVRLERVPVAERAPILRAYLKIAPGARPHIPIDLNAPLASFTAIAADYPVFRVLTMTADAG